MSVKTRVYIAGPLGIGDLNGNIRQGVDAFMVLLHAGYAPFLPHLTCYLENGQPNLLPYGTSLEEWYEWSLSWVQPCDALLRLPGVSVGADKEAELADRLGIPVFHDLDTLMKTLPKTQKGRRRR